MTSLTIQHVSFTLLQQHLGSCQLLKHQFLHVLSWAQHLLLPKWAFAKDRTVFWILPIFFYQLNYYTKSFRRNEEGIKACYEVKATNFKMNSCRSYCEEVLPYHNYFNLYSRNCESKLQWPWVNLTYWNSGVGGKGVNFQISRKQNKTKKQPPPNNFFVFQ